MDTGNISWGVQVACALGWQPYHLHVRLPRNLGAPASWNPKGLSRPVQELLFLYRNK
jgi:hypothetical protein